MRQWKRIPPVPDAVRRHLELAGKERVLAHAVDDNTGAAVVATTTHLVAATDDHQVLRRPWHEVDAAMWSAQHWTLSVTWVTPGHAVQWTFYNQETRLPETVHERVQASVVLSEPLPLPGRRHSGRVVVRKNLATDELFTQTVLGRGVPAGDPEVRAVVQQVTASLREQVGL